MYPRSFPTIRVRKNWLSQNGTQVNTPPQSSIDVNDAPQSSIDVNDGVFDIVNLSRNIV
jgi:hypothetical protein